MRVAVGVTVNVLVAVLVGVLDGVRVSEGLAVTVSVGVGLASRAAIACAVAVESGALTEDSVRIAMTAITPISSTTSATKNQKMPRRCGVFIMEGGGVSETTSGAGTTS